MDQLSKRIITLVKQNKSVLLIIVLGLLLMLIPMDSDKPSAEVIHSAEGKPNLQEEMEEVLAQIQGVGKVRVMLTVAEGERTIYTRDEQRTDSQDRTDLHTDVVLITDAQRTGNGLVEQVISPVYKGAIVVCQGGDSGIVRLAVVDAVCDVTGLTADKVTVLKMK